MRMTLVDWMELGLKCWILPGLAVGRFLGGSYNYEKSAQLVSGRTSQGKSRFVLGIPMVRRSRQICIRAAIESFEPLESRLLLSSIASSTMPVQGTQIGTSEFATLSNTAVAGRVVSANGAASRGHGELRRAIRLGAGYQSQRRWTRFDWPREWRGRRSQSEWRAGHVHRHHQRDRYRYCVQRRSEFQRSPGDCPSPS